MNFIYLTISIPTMEHPYQWVVTKLGGNKSFYCHSPFMMVTMKVTNICYTSARIFIYENNFFA